jgi:hypothetical protein
MVITININYIIYKHYITELKQVPTKGNTISPRNHKKIKQAKKIQKLIFTISLKSIDTLEFEKKY